MSERMIELARIKGQIPASSTMNGGSMPQVQQPASAALLDEDTKLQAFLHLIASVDEAPQRFFTCVPPPLVRRILESQGVSYLDSHVAHLASLAADKFLATLVSQSVACRGHRIKGDDALASETLEHREYRKRRRKEFADQLRKKQSKERTTSEAKVKLVAAHRALTVATKDKSKRKKESITSLQHTLMNAHEAVKQQLANGMDDDDEDGDEEDTDQDDTSLANDDNEDYLYLHGANDDDQESLKTQKDEEDEDDEEDENRFALQLRDTVRPLQAWGIQLTGKIGVAAPLQSTPETCLDSTWSKTRQSLLEAGTMWMQEEPPKPAGPVAAEASKVQKGKTMPTPKATPKKSPKPKLPKGEAAAAKKSKLPAKTAD